MARKLALENIVCVQMVGHLQGSRRDAQKKYDFDLFMDRRDQDEINTTINDGGKIEDFLIEITHGWERQRLVLEADDTPSEFSADAFRDMLRIPGMRVAIYQKYLVDVGAKGKN